LLLGIAGGNGLVGCTPGTVPTDGWMSRVARAGIQAGRLVLFDAAGHELGRLHRA